jgi:phosphoribosylamine--glycine ligase
MLIHNEKPYCLEFNVRFGDPETQSVMRRLGKGFANALLAVAKGEPIPEVEILDNAAVTVVMASEGYPAAYEKGREMTIGAMPDDVIAFHAGTARNNGKLVNAGGRVLGVSATGKNVEAARAAAYEGVKRIQWEGAHYRSDIAASS